MKTLKKVLAVVLTLIMACSGLVFGASATTGSSVGTYAEVQADAEAAAAEAGTTDTNFVYVATEFCKEDGTILGHNDTVQEGETLTCNVYLKSSYALYRGTVLAIVFDNELFDMSDFAENFNTYVDTTYVKATSTMVENPMDLETYTSVAEEVNNDEAGSRYSLIKLTLNSTTTATETLARNQVTFDPTGDTALTAFTIKVKDSVSVNSGFAKVPSTFFYSDSTGSAGYDSYPSVLAIGGTTAAAKRTTINLLETDGNYTFSVYKPKTVTFADAAGNAITTETVESGNNAEAVSADVLPADFYKWTDTDGNLFSNEDLADVTVESNMTFTAVSTTDTVDVTFDPDGGTLTYPEDETQKTSTEPVTISVPVTGFNIDDYTATMDGAEFKTWVDADMAAVSGTVVPSTVNAVTYTANWNADVSVMVKTLSGEWVEAFTYTGGDYGKTMTKDDANALVALANENLENIGKLIGAADEDLTYGFRCGNDTSATFTTTLKEANLGGYNAFKTTGDAISSSNSFTYSNMTFGKDFTALYLETSIRYTVNVYRPDATTLAYDETTPSYTTNFDFYGADGYKRSSTGYGYGMTNLGAVTTTNVLGDFTYDTNQYNLGYVDGNGTALDVSGSTITVGAANVNGGKGSTISIYVVLTGKDYRIGYIIGDTSLVFPYSSESTFKFGDEVSYEDIKKVYTKNAYGGNNFIVDSQTGSYLEGDTDSFYETLASIPQAGNYFRGSRLKSIDYTNADGEKVDFRDAGKIKIDENLLSQCETYTYTMDDGTTLICLTSTRVTKTYRYNLWYQDTTVGNWVKIVDQQAFTGSTAVTYDDFVTYEISQLISENSPATRVPLSSFSTEPDGKSATIKAYASEGKTDSAGNEDSMDLYVVYELANVCGDNLIWSLEDGTLTISGTGDMYDYYYWNSNAPWYSYRDSITDIVIESGVTSIGDYAFYDCYNLESVTILDSVTSIGDYAFYDCRSLTSVTIPDGVAIIGDYAFYDCRSLTSVTIPDGVTNIGDFAFYYCRSLTSVTIPDGVTSIGDYAFNYCDSLAITIPDSVTSIGEEAFYDVDSVILGDNISDIDDNAFYSCYFIYCNPGTTTFDTVTEAGYSVIVSDCPDYKISVSTDDNGEKYIIIEEYIGFAENVVIPDNIDGITVKGIDFAFDGDSIYCQNLTSVVIPDSVTVIGGGAFYYCSALRYVYMPDHEVTLYEDTFGTFENCPNVAICCHEGSYWNSYCVENGLRYCLLDDDNETGFVIRNQSLREYCGSKTEAVVPGVVSSIGYGAFEGNSTIESIEIPYCVSQISGNAFKDCTALKTVIVPYTVTSINASAFDGTTAEIACYYNSYAYKFAVKNNIPYELITVSFASESLSLTPSESVNLGAAPSVELTCGLPMVFMSADESVATVDAAGNVTAVGTGTTTIKAYTDNLNYLGACPVTVSGEEHTHSYTSEITKQPTCTEEGTITYTCSCGDTYTETIPAIFPAYSVNTDKVVRGDYVTWTFTTSADVARVKIAGTYTGADGTAKKLVAIYKSTGTNVTYVPDEEAGTATWTVTAKMNYSTADDKIDESITISYMLDDESAWHVVNETPVTITVGRSESVINPEAYAPYTLIDVTAPETAVTGTRGTVTIRTTDDCTKVRIGLGTKYATFQTTSANCTCSDADGIRTWTISYKFASAGANTYSVSTRGSAWSEAKTFTTTVA